MKTQCLNITGFVLVCLAIILGVGGVIWYLWKMFHVTGLESIRIHHLANFVFGTAVVMFLFGTWLLIH